MVVVDEYVFMEMMELFGVEVMVFLFLFEMS